MSQFIKFKKAMQEQFKKLTDAQLTLFLTDVTKDEIWETYLGSFPDGTNKIYKERGEYDCVACRQFLRPFANVVAIIDNTLVSIWDIDVPAPYDVVAEKLSNLVKSKPVRDVFITKFQQLGTDHNHMEDENGKIIRWDHFAYKIPKEYTRFRGESIAAFKGDLRASKEVFQRSLQTIKVDAVNTVLELIGDNSLYKGKEWEKQLQSFAKFQREFNALNVESVDNYCWSHFMSAGPVAKIRNNSIGTLLVNLSEGMELNQAVSKYEAIVAPQNYKRPKAIYTTKMIEEAEKTIVDLGFEHSLHRRYAVTDDITVNNVIYAHRDTENKMKASPLADMKKGKPLPSRLLKASKEMGIEEFIEKVVPNATNIELMLEGNHESNMFSLIAPEQVDATSMFKWHNNFSWAYNGDVTDSIKEAVKARGGDVTGVLRFSIMWAENDPEDNSDLDAWCITPDGKKIFFSRMSCPNTGGKLDVDIRVPNNQRNVNIVENITFPTLSRMFKGKYKFCVHNYSNRGSKGFTAQIEFNGKIYSYEWKHPLRQEEIVVVADVTLNTDSTFSINDKIPSTEATKEIWNIHTNQFTKVNMMMFSPNHWDEKQTGNKHYMFVLDNCINPGKPRGFFNEFLNGKLDKHKKVFEALGSKMRVDYSEEQLSGLGFSSTQRNSIVARVEGTFTRTIKINF